MKKVGFEKIEVISKLRNSRSGNKLAICANIRAYKSEKLNKELRKTAQNVA
jgi:hypothetical protein